MDNTAPTISYSPTSCDWKKSQTVTITISDNKAGVYDPEYMWNIEDHGNSFGFKIKCPLEVNVPIPLFSSAEIQVSFCGLDFT